MFFEWDERKHAANRRKHGISFDEARTVFYDENARLVADPDHSTEEHRFLLLGLSLKIRTLVVAHAYRDKDRTIRIFSARKATRAERDEYFRWLR